MTKRIILTFLLFSILQAATCHIFGQDFISKITLNAQKLPEEVRFNYVDLPQVLTNYVENFDWSNEELQYSIELNIAIYFEDIYRGYQDDIKGRFLVSTNTGIQYADKEWRFPYKKGDPIDHLNPQFSPFLGLIDYYL